MSLSLANIFIFSLFTDYLCLFAAQNRTNRGDRVSPYIVFILFMTLFYCDPLKTQILCVFYETPSLFAVLAPAAEIRDTYKETSSLKRHFFVVLISFLLLFL